MRRRNKTHYSTQNQCQIHPSQICKIFNSSNLMRAVRIWVDNKSYLTHQLVTYSIH